jgi:succinyl-CoA synthetase beta subunit
MELLEYQAKELFRQVGIPVLPSQSIQEVSEIKRLHIPYPVVLKSQVRAGGRGRAGGIRFVENTIDAIAAARAIFNLPIMGEYPEVIMAEAHYDAQQEFFLAVVLDYQIQRPVLLGSPKGGIEVESLLQHLQKVVVEDEFSPFYARRLVNQMGIKGSSLNSVSVIVEKMYNLFLEKDLDLIEINPLGASADGDLMALDGKISVNDYALARHPDIIHLTLPKPSRPDSGSEPEQESSVMRTPISLHGLDEKGKIGVIANSLGLALATWDLIVQHNGKPACYFIFDEKNKSNIPVAQELETVLNKMFNFKNIRTILFNLVGGEELDKMISMLQNYLHTSQEKTLLIKEEERIERPTGSLSRIRREKKKELTAQINSIPSNLKFVIRIAGRKIDLLPQSLTTFTVHWTDNLEEAIKQVTSIK